MTDPLPLPPVERGIAGAGVVAAPPLTDAPEPGAETGADPDPPVPTAAPDGEIPLAVVEAATYEAMAAALADSASATGQTV